MTIFFLILLVYMVFKTRGKNPAVLEAEIDELRTRLKNENDYNIALHSILTRYETQLGRKDVDSILDEVLENLKPNGDQNE